MKHSCAWCAFCVQGDVFVCIDKDKALNESSIGKTNNCKEFVQAEYSILEKEKDHNGLSCESCMLEYTHICKWKGNNKCPLKEEDS